MLTEAEVQLTFNQLVNRDDVNEETLEKAEDLLEELRAESPLRHRLSVELNEIRSLKINN
ncbi:MAG TPA: hypothetical protein DCP67_10985 [Planctomycetaceae bacterium]|nr:hypothetical protein [Rhodopirellula sp.]MCH2360836.1 hypothetical protein [Pirellulales bacterium]HAL14327.1 hypothetical protein [Planctomycetaceae bacterium]HCK72841.1 hypothetical protein [Planctomycetaceae bacterium]HCP85035.1 hypothetical protein [Planctomycetaceae bacterium]